MAFPTNVRVMRRVFSLLTLPIHSGFRPLERPNTNSMAGLSPIPLTMLPLSPTTFSSKQRTFWSSKEMLKRLPHNLRKSSRG